MRKVLLVVILAVMPGCTLPRAVQVGGESGLGNKVVSIKEEPTALVAVDATLCHTTPARFDQIKSGDRVWCHWRPRGADR